jgi:hypothetical protein
MTTNSIFAGYPRCVQPYCNSSSSPIFFHIVFAARWLLLAQFQRFVLINQSQTKYLERFHGRAVSLNPNDPRTPFHGAFLIHEMRVRGRWPLLRDRQIPLPILWQSWIPDPNVKISQTHDGHGEDQEDDRMGEENDSTSDNSSVVSSTPTPPSSSDHPPSHCDPNASGNFMTFTNPFSNPVELDSLKRSFAVQPNWKAAVVEGESWEGNAEQNTAKYRRLVGVIE